MKKYLRLFLFNLISLWVISQIFEGVKINGGYTTLVLSSAILTLVNLLIKPLLNILLLPINLLTLGTFRWLSNVIALYLVTLAVSEFKISGYLFLGFSGYGFVVPQIYIPTFWVFVLVSFTLSLVTDFLLWLTE